MKFKGKNNTGVTLIEMLVIIVIISICAVPLMSIFSQVLKTGAHNLIDTTLVYLAEGKMEEMIAWDFFTLEDSNIYGDTGSGNNDKSFDNPYGAGWNSPLDSYRWSVDVYPINPDYAGNLADSGAQVPNRASASVGGNFLRVHVRVEHAPTGRDVELWTIRTPN